MTYDYNGLNDLVQSSNLLDDQNRERQIHSFLGEINYGFTEQWSLTILLSGLVQKRINLILDRENVTVVSGFGDLVLLPKYNWIKDGEKKHMISSGVGIKVPTGKADIEYNGIDLPIDLQPGTGAMDLIIWSNFLLRNIKNKNLSAATNFTYRYTGTNEKYLGSIHHRFGNELILNAGLAYRAVFLKNIWDFGLGFRYRNVKPDQVNTETVPSTGGNWLDINPSITFNINPKATFRLGYLKPIYRKLIETQLTTSYKIYGSLTWNINLKPKKETP